PELLEQRLYLVIRKVLYPSRPVCWRQCLLVRKANDDICAYLHFFVVMVGKAAVSEGPKRSFRLLAFANGPYQPLAIASNYRVLADRGPPLLEPPCPLRAQSFVEPVFLQGHYRLQLLPRCRKQRFRLLGFLGVIRLIRIRKRRNCLSGWIREYERYVFCELRRERPGSVIQFQNSVLIQTGRWNLTVRQSVHGPTLALGKELALPHRFFLNTFGAEAVRDRQHHLRRAWMINPR